jgi:leader peptidase (prepilin peptidase) / N-methyltransferase
VLFELPHWFFVGVGVALGLLFGSFLNVVIYRLPREQSLVWPGSKCPACGTPIKAYDNVPVVSWLVLRGRARCCKAKIAVRYPLVELLGGLTAWALVETVLAVNPPDASLLRVSLLFLTMLVVSLGLIAAAFIDLEFMIVPDVITFGGAALGFLSVLLRPDYGWLDAVVGAALGFLLVWLPFDVGYRALRGHAGMGLGDAKLTLLAGAWFGYQGAVFTLLAGAVQGTIFAITLFIAKGRIDEPESVQQERAALDQALAVATPEERVELEAEKRADLVLSPPEPGLGKARIAFGPFLVLAFIEYELFGPWLISQILPGLQ